MGRQREEIARDGKNNFSPAATIYNLFAYLAYLFSSLEGWKTDNAYNALKQWSWLPRMLRYAQIVAHVM
jgi:hypothetical protein